MQQVELTRTVTATAVIIRLTGEVDVTTSNDAESRLALAVAALPPPELVILDLTEVGYLSAAGLRAVHGFAVSCTEHAVRTRLAITPGGIVYRIVTLLPLDPRLSTFATVAQALAAGAGS
jgi:anti-sigma B factor antagonist